MAGEMSKLKGEMRFRRSTMSKIIDLSHIEKEYDLFRMALQQQQGDKFWNKM